MADQQVQESQTEEAGSETVEAGAAAIQEAGGNEDQFFSGGPYKFKHFDGSEWEAGDRRALTDQLKRLDERLRHGGMRKEELDKERQKFDSDRKSWEAAAQKYKRREDELNTAYSRYGTWDKLMSERPELKQKMAALIDEYQNGSQSDRQQAALEAELKPIKSELESMRQERESQKQEQMFEAAAAELGKQYDGFDATAIRAALDELRSVPEADVPRKVLEFGYHALVGRKGIADLEARGARGTPKVPSVNSTPGAPPTEVDTADMDEEQKHAYAVELLRNMPE